ncbi:MAG: phosphate-starvation-inducible PsiE family protein [Nitrospiraceae bacterium]|nr:MAG: phosphate-starvation-inducible PsiE family protein [Nitrospiraceae bacterium]
MEQEKVALTEIFRKFLLTIDIIFHVVAALLLLAACGFILFYAFLHVLEPSHASMIALVNDVLLALIVLELLWTVIRFLKKQKFSLGPFLAIGIIAAVRRILLIEAQTSLMEHIPVEKLYEIGLSALVIIILMAAYYLAARAQRLEQ